MGKNASDQKPINGNDVADRLHSAAIHLLRRVRRHDPDSGLSAARLSALSVIVFGGPITITDLAQAEQVQLPTISRLVTSLEHSGLVNRRTDEFDRRVTRIEATQQGYDVLAGARQRRVRDLAGQLDALSADELDTVSRAVTILERLTD